MNPNIRAAVIGFVACSQIWSTTLVSILLGLTQAIVLGIIGLIVVAGVTDGLTESEK